jgi:D-amino-acid dehydrogenase
LRWLTKRDSPLHIRPRPEIVPWLMQFTGAAFRSRQRQRSTEALHELSQASLELHIALAQGGVQTSLERSGVLYLYETPTELRRIWNSFSKPMIEDLNLSQLGPVEAAEFEPAIKVSSAGAIYAPQEAQIDSLEYVRAVAEAARSHGARIALGTEVLDFDHDHSSVTRIHTTQGSIASRNVIIAAGAETGALGKRLGLKLPIAPAKGYHVDLANPPQFLLSRPIYMHESRVVATPYPGRLRLAGTLELVGFDPEVTRSRLESLRSAGQRNLHGVEKADVLHVWRGFRPTAPDGLPIIGRLRRFKNVVVASGHAMTGIALAPVTAVLVRELLEGTSLSYDVTLFAPERFMSRAGRRTA